MTFIFNFKGKKFTEDEISQRINAGISTESDKSTHLLIMNLSNTPSNLYCLIFKKYVTVCFSKNTWQP